MFVPVCADSWSDQLLKSLYFVTRDLGQAFATEVERLWTTLASNKRNIIPILDFLITKGLEEIHTEVCCLPKPPYHAVNYRNTAVTWEQGKPD